MKTKINNISAVRVYHKVMALALFFILLAPFNTSLAQTAGLVCDPLPEDIGKLQECLDLEIRSPGGSTKALPTVPGVGTGTWGMASAVGSDGNMLFISTTESGQSILGQFYDPANRPVGGSFTIDQWTNFVGSPDVIYNPEVNSFMVVWSASHPDNKPYIHGRIVNPGGAMPAGEKFLAGPGSNPKLSLDAVNRKYIVGYELLPAGPAVVTVSFDSSVNPPTILRRDLSAYEGQSSVTYNSRLNEYWYTYVHVTMGDTLQEDGRVYMARYNAITNEPVGVPIQLSETRIGHNNLAGGSIEYSERDGAAVAVWIERGKNPGMLSEVYGRTIYDNLSMSGIYPILASKTYSGSEFLGGAENLRYNPSTGTFALAGEDGSGGTMFVEFLSDGSILEIRQAISKSGRDGSFQPGVGVTPKGFVVFSSGDYTSPKFVTVASQLQPISPTTPVGEYTRTPSKLDASNISKMISQLYIWSLGLAGLAAVTYMVFGGYLVMTARGNGAQASKGKEFIVSSLIGLVILLSAFLILNTINSDLINFRIPSFDTIR